MEYSKNYRQQLIEFGNTTEYEILHMIIWNPTLKAQMKATVHQVIPVLIWMSIIQRSIRSDTFQDRTNL